MMWQNYFDPYTHHVPVYYYKLLLRGIMRSRVGQYIKRDLMIYRLYYYYNTYAVGRFLINF